MAVNLSKKAVSHTVPKAIALGVLMCILITAICTGVFAWLLITERVGENSIRYAALATLLVSSVTGTMVAMMYSKQKRLQVCAAVGGFYLLVLLAITALFYGGQYSGIGETAMIVFAGVVSVSLVGTKGNKKRKNRGKR